MVTTYYYFSSLLPYAKFLHPSLNLIYDDIAIIAAHISCDGKDRPSIILCFFIFFLQFFFLYKSIIMQYRDRDCLAIIYYVTWRDIEMVIFS